VSAISVEDSVSRDLADLSVSFPVVCSPCFGFFFSILIDIDQLLKPQWKSQSIIHIQS